MVYVVGQALQIDTWVFPGGRKSPLLPWQLRTGRGQAGLEIRSCEDRLQPR